MECLYVPACDVEPNLDIHECGPPFYGALGRKQGIGIMRVLKTTFLWMSEPYHISLICLFIMIRKHANESLLSL